MADPLSIYRSPFPVVVPFDFHRSRIALPDALDSGHAQTQSSDRKASQEHSGAWNLRAVQRTVCR